VVGELRVLVKGAPEGDEIGVDHGLDSTALRDAARQGMRAEHFLGVSAQQLSRAADNER
jgi:hypothetical protein